MTTRRQTLVVLGACPLALALSLGTLAQPVRRPVRIGMLSSGKPENSTHYYSEFKNALRELGWTEGRDIVFIERYAYGDVSRFTALAQELVAEKIDLLFANPSSAVLAAAKVAGNLPIVFAVSADPIGFGIVASLARPGGNVTGFSTMNTELTPKRIQLLLEIQPRMKRLAILASGKTPDASIPLAAQTAKDLGLEFQAMHIDSAADVRKVFESIARWKAGAVLVPAFPLLVTETSQIIEHAARLRLPAFYYRSDAVTLGGLISYSADFADNYRRAATYVDKILKGAKPADLPVEQPTKFELVINLKTARTLGIKIPQSILVQATKVIE